MTRILRLSVGLLVFGAVPAVARAQTPLTWPDVQARFRSSNPSLQAGQIGVDEAKTLEVTAYLRPNPTWSLTFDQIGHTTDGSLFSASILAGTFSYLHEREGKRELRRDSAQGATSLATSSQADLQRNLLFTLRARR